MKLIAKSKDGKDLLIEWLGEGCGRVLWKRRDKLMKLKFKRTEIAKLMEREMWELKKV